MLELNVYCIEKTPHLSMPVTGLRMLEEQKKVRLSFEIDRENRRKFPYAPLLGVYGGGKRILFDLADGYGTEVEHAQPWVAGQADLFSGAAFLRKRMRNFRRSLGNGSILWDFIFMYPARKIPLTRCAPGMREKVLCSNMYATGARAASLHWIGSSVRQSPVNSRRFYFIRACGTCRKMMNFMRMLCG